MSTPPSSPSVPYHLIDVADPSEVYSLFSFQRDCYAVLRNKNREERSVPDALHC